MIIEILFKKYSYLVRGKIVTGYLKIHGCKVGRNLKCKRFPIWRTIPQKNVFIGNDVNIGYRITFDIQKSGLLTIGDQTNLTQDIIISSAKGVSIGSNVLIAENVSIRDGDHGTSIGIQIYKQELICAQVTIGDDVWIGAGAKVLRGSRISNGCVIASNSVVIAKCRTNPNTIYGGIPIRELKTRC